MAHAPETREAVRRSYVSERLSLEAAAARHGVPFGTVRKWKAADEARGDDWDRSRAAAALSSTGAATVAQLVLHDFLLLHEATVEALKADQNLPALQKAEAMSRLADAFTKTMSAVAKAAPELGRFAVATELLADLASYVAEHFPEHQPALAEIFEPFGAFIAKKYG
ncbi:MAG: DUF1804 family protein [Pseudomonadota bacterium]